MPGLAKLIIPTLIGMTMLYGPFLWCRHRGESTLSYGLSWRFDRSGLREGILLTAGVLTLLTVIALRWPLEDLPRRSGLWRTLDLLAAGLAAAIIEEVFFRGFIQTLLRRRMGAVAAIGLTGVLFALSHVFVARLPFLFAVFFPGCIMGFLRERHGNISTSTLFHFLGNVWAIWFAPLNWPKFDELGRFLEALL